MLGQIEAYIAPTSQHQMSLSLVGENLYAQVREAFAMTAIANLFFGVISSNIYISALRFTISAGCLFLDDAILSERFANLSSLNIRSNVTKLTVSVFFLVVVNAFLFLECFYAFIFCKSILSGLCAPWYLAITYQNLTLYEDLVSRSSSLFVQS